MGGVRARLDTRNKILTPQAAAALSHFGLTVVSGTFDVLRASLVDDLHKAASGATLLAAVLPSAFGLASADHRAEMLAAIRVVDYVVITDHAELERLIRTLQPCHVVRLEESDACRTRELIEHVRRRAER